jgi:hypothetical protein
MAGGLGALKFELRPAGLFAARVASRHFWRISAPCDAVAIAHDAHFYNYALVLKFRSVYSRRTVYEFVPAVEFFAHSSEFAKRLCFAGLEIEPSLRSELAMRRYLQTVRPALRVVIPPAGGFIHNEAEEEWAASEAYRKAVGDTRRVLPDLEESTITEAETALPGSRRATRAESHD